jgi:hypothetical protein
MLIRQSCDEEVPDFLDQRTDIVCWSIEGGVTYRTIYVLKLFYKYNECDLITDLKYAEKNKYMQTGDG